MVRSAIKAITSKMEGIRQAAFWLSLFALFSQILALLRDRLLAHHFGAGVELDMYYAAFKIPDLLFVTVASLVSISALVPLFAKKESEGEVHLKDATASIFTVFSALVFVFCIIAWILMPLIVNVSFAGLLESARTQTIFLSRVLLLSPLLLGFSNFFGSIVQYEKRFVLYSLSPLLYNMGIIFGIVFLSESFGIAGVVYGVIVGAVLHLILQASFVMFGAMRPRFTSHIKWKDVFETAYLSVPRTLALSIVSFVGFVFVALASRLGEGSITVFNLSFNLQSAPLSLIGVSFSLASFPALAISASRKDMEDIVLKISSGLRQIIFWSLPFTALIIVLRAHIVRVILGSGDFGWAETRLVAASLSLFALSSVFQSIQLFISRSHYALGKTKWPLFGNVVGGLVSVVSALLFMKYFSPGQGGDGLGGAFSNLAEFLKVSDLSQTILFLPIAFSLGSFISAMILFLGLGKELSVKIWRNIRGSILNSLVVATASGVGAYFMLSLLDHVFSLNSFSGVFGHGLLAGITGIIIGIMVAWGLRSLEFLSLLEKGKHE